MADSVEEQVANSVEKQEQVEEEQHWGEEEELTAEK